MNKKKICVCHLVYNFDVGGLERIIVNCINNLNSIEFHHVIISLNNIGEFYSEIDVPVECYALNKKQGNDISVYFRLYKLLRRLHPDVMHTYNLGTIEYQWVAWLARVPLRIHAEHGRDSYDPNGAVKKYQWLRRICALVIHHIVAVSDDLKCWLAQEVKIPERKLCLIINGVDTQYYSKQNSVPTVAASFIRNKCVFGHVARLHQIKNQMFLLQAFQQACVQSEDFAEHCVLMIVGDGPDRQRLETFVLQHEALVDKVLFTGSQLQVRDYYQCFDVFTMSSVAEGIPMTLIESMAMSIPHLVTRVGGIKEVICEEQTGLSVLADDLSGYVEAMVRLYRNKNLRAVMSVNARKRIEEKFSQDTMVMAYQKIYQGETGRD